MKSIISDKLARIGEPSGSGNWKLVEIRKLFGNRSYYEMEKTSELLTAKCMLFYNRTQMPGA